jgi:hypothetical protein
MASSQSQEAIAAIDLELKTILKRKENNEDEDTDTDTEIYYISIVIFYSIFCILNVFLNHMIIFLIECVRKESKEASKTCIKR